MYPRKKIVSLLLSGISCAALSAGVLGCRGDLSEDPPVHLNPNMDNQKRFDPQEENSFFVDRRAMRVPVAGTVAVGELQEDEHSYLGKENGAFVDKLPFAVTPQVFERGRDRFGIYCAVCHGAIGDGNSVVANRGVAKHGMVRPTNLVDDRIRKYPLGQIFDVISNGIRTMPGYAAQIAVADRWAIAAYVRALQVSQNATLEDVPPDVAQQNGWTK